jgi:hypothetical protein
MFSRLQRLPTHQTTMAGRCVRTECCDGPCWGTGGPAAVSLRGLGLFSGLTPGLRPDWRPGLCLGLFSFAPSELGFGGVGVGVTCVLCERLDVAWLASANARSLGFARDDRVSDERWGRSI